MRKEKGMGIRGDCFCRRWVDFPAAAFNTGFGNREGHLVRVKWEDHGLRALLSLGN